MRKRKDSWSFRKRDPTGPAARKGKENLLAFKMGKQRRGLWIVALLWKREKEGSKKIPNYTQGGVHSPAVKKKGEKILSPKRRGMRKKPVERALKWSRPVKNSRKSPWVYRCPDLLEKKRGIPREGRECISLNKRGKSMNSKERSWIKRQEVLYIAKRGGY